MSKDFMSYEDITQLIDTQLEELKVEREKFESTHDKQRKTITDEYDKQLKQFNKAFEKEVKSYFKGVKLAITHSQYGMNITNNECRLFTLEYNNIYGNGIDCYNELVELYNKYYGKVKEREECSGLQFEVNYVPLFERYEY